VRKTGGMESLCRQDSNEKVASRSIRGEKRERIEKTVTAILKYRSSLREASAAAAGKERFNKKGWSRG